MTFKIKSEKLPLLKRLQQTSTTQRLVALLIITLITTGLTLVGQGLYIKAKAVVAQSLLEKA